jgi:hypothetical protein
MPNTLYAPDGSPIPSHFRPILQEKVLSLRDMTILKDMTEWLMARNLEPTLICKTCFENHLDTPNAKDLFSIQIAQTARGGIVAHCACSRWSTEQS